MRPEEIHGADDWRSVLAPMIVRYHERGCALYFPGDASFAKPALYELLEAESMGYATCLPTNSVLQERIGYLLTRPVGRSAKKPHVSLRASPTRHRGGPPLGMHPSITLKPD